jgi:hypothetical protein
MGDMETDMSIVRIATLATAALLIGAAPSFAKIPDRDTSMSNMVPQSVINAGPQLTSWQSNDAQGWSQAELSYLQKVCPTVLAHPGSQSATLQNFCTQSHG